MLEQEVFLDPLSVAECDGTSTNTDWGKKPNCSSVIYLRTLMEIRQRPTDLPAHSEIVLKSAKPYE